MKSNFGAWREFFHNNIDIPPAVRLSHSQAHHKPLMCFIFQTEEKAKSTRGPVDFSITLSEEPEEFCVLHLPVVPLY